MMKILNRYTGKLIKEIDADSLMGATLTGADLTNADLRDADLTNADLRYAELRYADLTNADLRDAELRYADLTNADLRDADLTNADLTNADLRDADLTDANLTNANLTGADLTGANLRGVTLFNTIGDRNIIITIQLPYHTNLTKDFMQIGCRRYTYEEWWNFTDNEIVDMDGERALNFWRKYKEYLQISYKLAFGEEKTPEE